LKITDSNKKELELSLLPELKPSKKKESLRSKNTVLSNREEQRNIKKSKRELESSLKLESRWKE
jgi:hypothetical protein